MEADAATLWARSGAMALTGRADAPPVVAPAALALAAQRSAAAFCAQARRGGSAIELDGPALLGERAAIAGLARRGRISPGGASRVLRSADSWLAVSLARPDDFAAVPAWLEVAAPERDAVWDVVARSVALRTARDLVERARLLGLAVAQAVAPAVTPRPGVQVAARGVPLDRDPAQRPLVVDLSSLWAGPLCTQLLQLAGARVVKVESTARPDAARSGPAAFFDLLHTGKQSVALDFATSQGRDALRRLVERADIVVESARPRALRQLGIDAESLVATLPGLTWVSITGYGRSEPEAGWVAFGDDAAAAAGLAAVAGRGDDGPLFCADAIADPLTGLHAADAALACWQSGGSALLDVSLRDVAAQALACGPEPVAASDAPVASPRARPARGRARPLGADTATVAAAFA
jgi:hypothetical protein